MAGSSAASRTDTFQRAFKEVACRRRVYAVCVGSAFFGVLYPWIVASEAPIVTNPVCSGCVRIRVGLPRVVRGPAADTAHNIRPVFTETNRILLEALVIRRNVVMISAIGADIG